MGIVEQCKKCTFVRATGEQQNTAPPRWWWWRDGVRGGGGGGVDGAELASSSDPCDMFVILSRRPVNVMRFYRDVYSADNNRVPVVCHVLFKVNILFQYSHSI